MARGSTGLESSEYDDYLNQKAKTGNTVAYKELRQRTKDKRNAHNADGIGWHFGVADVPVKARSREELKVELNKRGLMLRDDVTRKLR